ncbi:Lipase 3 [Frankliniella fusca]|uniref:Lipase n=1 Tax=Frankliniella fusca TaxID=407009 RepID=A0AAE1HNR1_9NEOP|nr:Lipase 3 [Frankliniella fusca]
MRRPKSGAPALPPESWMTTVNPELVEMWGYPVETHRVYTDDGYILEVHRIPGPRGSGRGRGARGRPAPSGAAAGTKQRPPVLMAPGFAATSECLVLRNNTLAFMLADADFDVWLINYRGSFYGRAHKSLRAADARFWDFGVHENGVHDVASTLRYMERATGQGTALYVGHSMGGTALLALLADRPEYNARLRAVWLLTPAAYFHHVRGGFAKIRRHMRRGYSTLALMRFENTPMRAPHPEWCFPDNGLRPAAACWQAFSDAEGPFHSSARNNTYVAVLLRHWPAGASMGQMHHFGQLIIRGDGFYKFDFGPERNLDVYGTVYPPPYNLTNVRVPTFIFYCKNDYQAHYKDVEKLAADLPGLAGLHLTQAERFNHIDMMYEEAAADLVYKRLIEQMTKYR